MTTHASTAQLQESAKSPLNQWQILIFYAPLAASWLLMTLEGPAINAAIARLPNAERMIAAYGIMISLSITIESPVIMLLGTATALARDRQAYLQLRRFTLYLITALTILTFLFGWTPLYDWVVRDAMGIPTPIADAALPGMRIMLLWTAAIGWRRFKQGVMIHHGAPQWVGYGTGVRLVASAGTAALLAFWGRWPGVWVGATALMAGVLADAAFAQWAARDVIAQHLDPHTPTSDQGMLTYREVVEYHTPLAATQLLVLLAHPVIGAALARTPDPETALAAWPMTFALLLIARSLGLALPEAIIALVKDPETRAPVRRFSRNLALFSLAALALVAFTPLAQVYFVTLIGITPELAAIAIQGVRVGVIIPLLMVWQSYVRGILMARKRTGPLSIAMGLHIVVLTMATLVVGVRLGLPGVPMAAGAITLAMFVEMAYLAWQARLTRKSHAVQE